MAYLWLFYAVCAVVICIFLDYLKNRKAWNMIQRIPGFKPILFFGNVPVYAILTSKDITTTIANIYQARLGVSSLFAEKGINHLWAGRKPIVLLTRPETAEVVLTSQVLIEKSDMYEMSSEWIGNGLATSTGDTWRHDRKQLNPAFNFRILEDFRIIMNEQATILVQKLKKDIVGQPWLDLQEHARLCALEVILETSMGIREEAQLKNSVYTTLVQRIATMMTTRAFRPWLYSNFIYYSTPTGKEYMRIVKQINKMTETIIEKKRSERDGKAKMDTSVPDSPDGPVKRRLALLDLLLEAGLNERQLREQVSTFVFAGHHTISMSVVWALYVIGLYPDVQAKLVDEVDCVFGQDTSREVTQEDLKMLKYMTRVMKETQRVYPTAPIIARRLTEDTKIGGYVVPAGTDCAISIASIHRNRYVYPDPERFDPDRFLPENSVGRHQYAFIPFSAGPRNCIGQRYAEMEIKVILCHLLRTFHFRSLDPRDKVHVIPDLNLRPLGKVRMEITPRKSKYLLEPETID